MDRPPKAARTTVLSNTRRLEAITASHRQSSEGEDVRMGHIVGVQGEKHGVALLLLRENLVAKGYVKVGAIYLDAKRFGALPSHGQKPRIL